MDELLSKNGIETIDKYANLPIGERAIRCPYYKNSTLARALSVYSGKGSPQEIVDEVSELSHKERIDFSSCSDSQVRDFLIEHGIGIDCSGFVSNVLNDINPEIIRGIQLDKARKNPIMNWYVNRFRKISNISVKTLTSDKNAHEIKSLHDIRPADMIETRNGQHVLLVFRVVMAEDYVREIEYAHSTMYYGKENGVRKGTIKITQKDKDLGNQEWTEVDDNTGVNYTHEGYLDGGRVFRLRYFTN